ncbi:hypothetical protein SBRCBS47491_002143 [Sporothrix bragantina]|uniref:Uncharacterized protein n=1 Tax=Sporothrix bragantina TaxID=671064 RepID=A0ABP0B522_9PEZI
MPASSPKYEFHVPGAYHFDNNPPQPSSGASFPPLGADVFLPPSDSIYLGNGANGGGDLTRSVGSLYSDIPGGGHSYENGGAKRKRAAQDSRETTPLTTEWDSVGRGAYTLAGQIDIAGNAAGMDESVYSDVAYRRALGPEATIPLPPGDDAAAAAERWNVLQALGNVVGKVWEFCTTSAFRGFHAGGGAGYDWETGKPTEGVDAVAAGPALVEGEEDQPQPQSQPQRDELPTLPQQTPQRNPFVECETTPTPTARNGKRRQVSMNENANGDEPLRRNWVMVDPRQKQRAAQQQTPRAVSTAMSSTATSRQRTAPLFGGAGGGRASMSATPTRNSTTTKTPDRRATSYTRGGGAGQTTATPGTAASRRINTPISRMGGGATPTPHSRRTGGASSAASTARLSHAGSPGLLSSREPASFASPRSSTPVGGTRIPMPPLSSGVDVNPFARASAGSPRPGSRAGSSLGMSGRSSSMAVGRPSSPANLPKNGQGHGHRRSYSGRVGMSPLPKKTMSVLGADDSDAANNGISVTESPRLNDEAKRLAAQNLAAEQESDAKMEAFNLRLQEMIRQGQQALGTTFEVDVDDDDDGRGGGDDYWADD